MKFRSVGLLYLVAHVAACGSSDDSETITPEPPPIQVTQLELGVEPGAIRINDRIPITVGLTAEVRSSEPEPMPVVFSFVDPTDPNDEAGTSCSSNGLLFDIEWDGQERIYEAVIWPYTGCQGLVGRPTVLQVEFDPSNEERDFGAPIVFSPERADANRGCRGTVPGCAYELNLTNEPGTDGIAITDIEFPSLSSESSVALLPPLPGTNPDAVDQAPEDLAPSILVRAELVYNGRDPYESVVELDKVSNREELVEAEPGLEEDLRFGRSPEEVPEMEQLPGVVTMTYAMTPVSDGETWLPLSIGSADGRQSEVQIAELTPGIANEFSHELFIEGATYDAILDDWAGEESFQIRGCFTANFEQFQASPEEGRCRTIDVIVTASDQNLETAAGSVNFDIVRQRRFGGRRVGLESTFELLNSVSTEALTSHTEARVSVNGRIGARFDVDVLRAFGDLEVPFDGERKLDMAVELFGVEVASNRPRGEDAEEVEEGLNISRSRRLVRARFMFGPVPVRFSLEAGGQAGVETDAGLSILLGEENCRPLLPVATEEQLDALAAEQAAFDQRIAALQERAAALPNRLQGIFERLIANLESERRERAEPVTEPTALVSCLSLEGAITPTASFTASGFGGVSIRIASAGVQVDLVIAQLDLPATAGLALGLDVDGRFLMNAGAGLDLEFTPLAGKLKLVGRIRFFRFKRRKSVTIASFKTRTQRKSLFQVQLPHAEVLSL